MEKPMPSSTATQTRIPIFEATKTAKRDHVSEVKSKWGTAKIEGPLTQIHRSIIDILLTCYPQHKAAGGEIIVIFPMHDLLKRMRNRTGGWNRDWLKEKLSDLRRASLTIDAKHLDGTRVQIEAGIISEHCSVDIPNKQPRYGVKFSLPYVQYVMSDLGVRYSPEQLDTILSFDALLQAVARFALTHRSINMTLNDILSHIRADQVSDSMIRRRIRSIHAASDQLDELGFELNGKRGKAVLSRKNRRSDA